MTVQELINILNAYPKDSIVVIEDADTDWYLELSRISVVKDLTVLRAEYSDQIELDDE
jgi:hypothetical protein